MGHGWFRVGNPPFLLRLTFFEIRYEHVVEFGFGTPRGEIKK